MLHMQHTVLYSEYAHSKDIIFIFMTCPGKSEPLISLYQPKLPSQFCHKQKGKERVAMTPDTRLHKIDVL
jgi:hypothetical protein